MSEQQAYNLLQEMIAIAEQLVASGHYGADEIVMEVINRIEVAE